MPRIDTFLKFLIEKGGSDLHISVGAPPMIRLDGRLIPLKFRPIEKNESKVLLYEIMSDFQKERFEEFLEVDFGYEISGLSRFRCNVFTQRKGISAALRAIPTKISSVEDLGLPKVILDFTQLLKGLVIVTGPTGSGKSTTLAAMVDYINKTREHHIITIEDPIEFVHTNKKCLINQRELYLHTKSFANAIRVALREDPDVILVGEMRDLETIELAITAAETGHLVFGTLHTISAPKTIDRIINVFPVNQQEQIRMMLSESLKGVVSQILLPKVTGGRCAAVEIMIGNHAVSNLIRENKTFQIKSTIQTHRAMGMQTMDQCLLDLLSQKLIKPEDAFMSSEDKSLFEPYLKRQMTKGTKKIG